MHVRCVCICIHLNIFMYVCVGVTITTPFIIQNWLVNSVPAYFRTQFGDFGRFLNANIFDEWLEWHIRHICPYGT